MERWLLADFVVLLVCVCGDINKRVTKIDPVFGFCVLHSFAAFLTREFFARFFVCRGPRLPRRLRQSCVFFSQRFLVPHMYVYFKEEICAFLKVLDVKNNLERYDFRFSTSYHRRFLAEYLINQRKSIQTSSFLNDAKRRRQVKQRKGERESF